MRTAPVAAPQPHRRVVAAPLGDHLALFHLDTRRLHLLNGSAAAIWQALPGVDTVGELTVRLGDDFGVDPLAIRRDVEHSLDQLRADGLLCVDDRFAPARPTAPSTFVPGREADGARGCFAALDARVRLCSDDAEIGAVVAAVLAPLASDDTPTHEISIRAGENGAWLLRVDDGATASMASPLSIVLRAVAEINNLAVASVPDHLVFHAGAVARDGAAVLLPAASNHGKSTLTTALVRAGMDYLTDEAAAVGPDEMVRPYAKAIALDPGSFPLFSDLAPAPDKVGLARAIACREWHIAPDRLGSVGESSRITAIVCPHWRAGASTRVTEIAADEALHLLLGETFDFAPGGQAVFERLVRLVDDVPVYRLGYGELAEAVVAVERILAE
ncbi:MAG: PqqD family protein [Acidimicrobiales bacterium]|nr:PqqD family protein [Acidimicrobiales bacterium]